MKIRGTFYPNDIFLGSGVDLDFPREEFCERVTAGHFGHGVKILSGHVGKDVILGDYCISLGMLRGSFQAGKSCVFGNGCSIQGGVCGDQVTFGDGVLIKGDIEIGSYVQVGDKTSISGKGRIGDYVIIGAACALESVEIESGTVLGNHVFTEGNPKIVAGTLIPNGSLVLRRFSSASGIEVVPY